MSLFASLASATAIAYVADYAAHFEWHFSRVVVRRDALVAAVLLGVVVGAKLIFQRRRKSGPLAPRLSRASNSSHSNNFPKPQQQRHINEAACEALRTWSTASEEGVHLAAQARS